MTAEQKDKVLKISLIVLFCVSILLSISGFVAVRSTSNSLEQKMTVYEQSISKNITQSVSEGISQAISQSKEEILDSSKRTAFAEISRARQELLELVMANKDNLLAMQSDVFELQKDMHDIKEGVPLKEDDITKIATPRVTMTFKKVEVERTDSESPKKELDIKEPEVLAEKIVAEEIPAETKTIVKEVAEQKEVQRPVWKRVVQFWKWF